VNWITPPEAFPGIDFGYRSVAEDLIHSDDDAVIVSEENGRHE